MASAPQKFDPLTGQVAGPRLGNSHVGDAHFWGLATKSTTVQVIVVMVSRVGDLPVSSSVTGQDASRL